MIDLVPLKLFSKRHQEGWRMVHGYPLKPGDFAVTMQSPDHRDEMSNRRRGGQSGAGVRAGGRRKFPSVK